MKLKKLITLFLLIIPFTFIYGEENTNENTNIKFEKPSSNRPRTPDVMNCPVSGYYSNGVVYLYFNEAIGETSVEISNTDTGDIWAEMFSAPSACEQVFIGNDSGYYSIYITTDCGDTYIGFFQL